MCECGIYDVQLHVPRAIVVLESPSKKEQQLIFSTLKCKGKTMGLGS